MVVEGEEVAHRASVGCRKAARARLGTFGKRRADHGADAGLRIQAAPEPLERLPPERRCRAPAPRARSARRCPAANPRGGLAIGHGGRGVACEAPDRRQRERQLGEAGRGEDERDRAHRQHRHGAEPPARPGGHGATRASPIRVSSGSSRSSRRPGPERRPAEQAHRGRDEQDRHGQADEHDDGHRRAEGADEADAGQPQRREPGARRASLR